MPSLSPIHPGEVLTEEFLRPLGLTVSALASALGVAPSRLSALRSGRAPVSAELALRLGRYFGTTPDLWMNLQVRHDLACARESLADRLDAEVRPRQDPDAERPAGEPEDF